MDAVIERLDARAERLAQEAAWLRALLRETLRELGEVRQIVYAGLRRPLGGAASANGTHAR
jgi:hypothetical protein